MTCGNCGTTSQPIRTRLTIERPRVFVMAVNSEIFSWGRETAGLILGKTARALDFQDTRQRSATERLIAFESGMEQPSRSVLLRMAKAYRRALLVFYLAQPPRTGDRGQDFRTVPGGTPPEYSPLLDALIRDIRGRQTAVHGLMEEEDRRAVDFVGAATMSEPVESLAQRMSDRLQFSLQQFRRQSDVNRAF